MLYKVCQSVRNRFVVTGAPGSGKTPILRELVRLGFLGVNEPAREILAEQRAIRGNGVHDKDPQLFCDLMLERAIADYQRLGGAGEPAFFDRGIPDMVGSPTRIKFRRFSCALNERPERWTSWKP